METTLWHDGALIHPKSFGKETEGFLGIKLQSPIIVTSKTDYAYGGPLHVITYARILHLYNKDDDGLSDVYWAFLEDFMSGFPSQDEARKRIQ